jgi:hypothetical protein
VRDTVDFASPFQSLQAVLEIVDAELEHGDYGPQIRVDLEVVSDGKDGSENGTRFMDWFGFGKQQNPDKPRISPRSKAGQLVRVTVGEPMGSLKLSKLVGHRFRAQVGLNKAGTYSKVVSDTLMPAPKDAADEDEDLEGIDVEDLDMSRDPEPPDFSDLGGREEE